MATKTVKVSDLTGAVIDNDDDTVTIIVREHPTLERPVQLDASKAEVKSIKGADKEYVIIDIVSDGGDNTEHLVLELAEFDKLIQSGDPQDVLESAAPYGTRTQPVQEEQPRRRGRPPGSGTASKPERVDYKTAENFGLIHRGRITEEEKAMVQGDLDGANANRKREGQPEIDLASEKDVVKYDLHSLAQKAGVVPK